MIKAPNNVGPYLGGIGIAVTTVFAVGIVGSAPAVAQVEACPSGWSKSQEAKGYQMCTSNLSVIGASAVQIVDLKAGARIVIGSELKSGSGTAAAKYVTRTADEWWNFMLNYTSSPTGAPLQAVVNASFFMDPDSSITRLSFAQKKNNYVETSGQGCYFDFQTGQDCTRPDQWGKRKLGFYQNGEKALIKDYTYNGWDYRTTVNYMSDVSYGLVGYGPNSGPTTGNGRRTYVGGKDTDSDGALDRLYILTTVDEISREKAIEIMTQRFGTNSNIQFDGGGSTQLKSRTYSFGSKGCFTPLGCRKVPNVLAIYAAS